MSSQKSTPASTPRSTYSATSSIARSIVKPSEFVAAVIRLFCQESGGEIDSENLHVAVQGRMSHTLEEVDAKAAELGEVLATEHQLVVTSDSPPKDLRLR
eukprot:5190945-Amphidinium_carterae.6